MCSTTFHQLYDAVVAIHCKCKHTMDYCYVYVMYDISSTAIKQLCDQQWLIVSNGLLLCMCSTTFHQLNDQVVAIHYKCNV